MPRRASRSSALSCSAEAIHLCLGTLRPPDENLVERLRLWTELLDKWSGAQRLVGWRRSEDLLHEGLLDAWAAVPLLIESAPRPLLDLGSGSGLPGIVLAAAYPSRELHLVEARRKRASFLSASVRSLGLKRVIVHQGRVEEVAQRGLLPKCATVTARAFAAPLELLALAEQLEASRTLLSIGREDLGAEWPGSWSELERCAGSPQDRRIHVLLKR
jgi:16S rRNA (guanine(527)-N(7))-methyltransferase RsmG